MLPFCITSVSTNSSLRYLIFVISSLNRNCFIFEGSDASSSVAADELDFRERYFKLLKDRNKDGYLDMVCIILK